MTDLERLLRVVRAKHLTLPGRRSVTAIGLESALGLWELLQNTQPECVLDLGSGFSTIVTRTWAQGQDVAISTVDTDAKWLRRTGEECRHAGLDASRFYLWDDFRIAALAESFDFIFVDLAKASGRATEADAFIRLCSPEGVMVLDDWQFEYYRKEAEPIYNDAGFTVDPLPWTMDKHDRYMALARRD